MKHEIEQMFTHVREYVDRLESRIEEATRAGFEIGFDAGVAACEALEGGSVFADLAVNPFRRASTVITQLERVAEDRETNELAHLAPTPACTCVGPFDGEHVPGCAAPNAARPNRKD